MSVKPISIAIWVGTRPEYIKMAPLVLELQRNARFMVHFIHSGQHESLGKGTGQLFGIRPVELSLPPTDGHLELLEKELQNQAFNWFREHSVDLVLVQGDTATAYCIAHAAHLLGIPIGHVEAGLRTYDITQPFPEEGYRQAITKWSTWHYSPSDQATKNLVSEGVDPSTIHQVGNTIVDAFESLKQQIYSPNSLDLPAPYWVMTLHRRESQGEPAKRVIDALKSHLAKHPLQQLVVIRHPNPKTHPPVDELKDHPQVNILDALEYLQFLTLCAHSDGLLSDSGGLQEEAPLLGLPIVVFRRVTERPEVMENGYGMLVGTDTEKIHIGLNWLQNLEKPINKCSLYGDGMTSRAIHSHLSEVLLS